MKINVVLEKGKYEVIERYFLSLKYFFSEVICMCFDVEVVKLVVKEEMIVL